MNSSGLHSAPVIRPVIRQVLPEVAARQATARHATTRQATARQATARQATVRPSDTAQHFADQANQNAWEKFASQTEQAVVSSRDRNSFMYPTRHAETDIQNVAGNDVRRSVIATILFLVLSNPEVFKFIGGLLKGVDVINENSVPTTTGIVISGVLFFLIYYLIAYYLPVMGV